MDTGREARDDGEMDGEVITIVSRRNMWVGVIKQRKEWCGR